MKVNEPKFMTAFYYSLRDTLVATDIEQGSRIAFAKNGGSRNRVVTLRGEIIETSGTMSGGGQPQRGRMGSKIVADDFSGESMRDMQTALAEDERELAALTARRHELETNCAQVKQALDECASSVSRLASETSGLGEQVVELRKLEASCARKIQGELKPDEAKQRQMQSEVDKLSAAFHAADKEAAKLRDQNDELSKQIVEISGRILGEPKAELDRLRAAIEAAASELTKLTVEAKASKRQVLSVEKKLAAMRDDLEANEAIVTRGQQRLATLDQDVQELREQYEAVRGECETLSEKGAQMAKEAKRLEAGKQKMDAERIDAHHSYTKQSGELEQLEHEHQKYERLCAALRLHNIDDLVNGDIGFVRFFLLFLSVV